MASRNSLPRVKGWLLVVAASFVLHAGVTKGRSRDYNNEIYNWQTGPWGVCWSKAGCGQGAEERTVWCGDSLGRPVPSYLCRAPEKPAHSRPCFTACKGQWKVGLWGPCRLENGNRLKQGDGLCLGVRHRNVTCYSSYFSKDDQIPTCPESIPPSKVSCYTLCPQDCVVGPWTMWTPCSHECAAEKRYRTRQVVVGPDHGGVPCPSLGESQPCDENCTNESPNEIALPARKVRTFSPFSPFMTTAPSSGQSLNAALSSSSFSSSSLSSKDNSKAIPHYHYPRLPKLRVGEWDECMMPTSKSDSFSPPLSSFSSSSTSSSTTSSPFPLYSSTASSLPTSLVSPSSNANPYFDQTKSFETRLEWEIRDAFSILEVDNTEDEMYVPGYLSAAQLDEITRMSFSYPRVGMQERSLSCVGSSGETRPLRECIQNGTNSDALRMKSCIISLDCQLTEWSEWKTITEGCVAPNGQVVREVRERRRSALSLQRGHGTPCPHLLERHTVPEPSLQPCNSKYQWLASSWGPCLSTVGPAPESQVTCGGGVQKRRITCVTTKERVPVPEKFCVHVEPPPRYQRCEVGCERDCTVGPWSAWGVCTPGDCTTIPFPTTPGFRRRIREAVVSPSSNGTECPPLEEQTECLSAQCHQWLIGRWSECFLDNQAQLCGKGHIVRNITCVDVDGNLASNEECQIELGAVDERDECHVPCSFDCVLASWSTWTPCSRACADSTSVGYTHRNTTILAPSGPGGKECPAPDELTQVKTCREEPCAGAAWVPGQWGKCIPQTESVCGPGTQIRPLFCIGRTNNEQIENYKCAGLNQPKQERACEIPCGKNCEMTSWSEWSECVAPNPCPKDNRTVTSWQTRWRSVVVHPSEGKPPCGLLNERRSCALNSGSCKAAEWQTSSWSDCALAPGVKCDTGYRVRGVNCINGSGDRVDPTECLLGDKIIPESSEECFVLCNKRCIVSSWSSWTPCPKDQTCSNSASFRARILLDGTDKNPKCSDISLQETKECPCMTYYSEPGFPWSQCILGPPIKFIENMYKETFSAIKSAEKALGALPFAEESLNNRTEEDKSLSLQENLDDLCGVGARYRSLKCLREDDVLANPSFCGHKGIEWEPCMMECPLDCLVDHWQEWSPCNATCGAGLQIRYRKVVQPNFSNGRKCPEIQQERACWGSCQTRWIAEGWSECQLTENGECGTGLQQRTIKCVQLQPSGMEKAVGDEYCDELAKPVNLQPCRVYCSGECVVSDWSDWSVCPSSCEQSAERSRVRKVIRRAMNNFSTCPHLKEEEPCILGVSCWRYAWKQNNWTSCVPLGRSSCGEGVRNRPVSCVRSDGVAVSELYCPRESRPSPQEKWCYVDCPIDCQVTQWTDWDDSKCSCGEKPGYMKRRRFILVNPSESGRLCPPNLEESLPCPVTPCYTWERGPWSECKLMGGECGHGVMERRVRCIGPGGVDVSPDKCLALVHVGGHTWPYLAHALDLNTKDGCYVPCDGDCELTEWSPWSHCHRDCSRGQQGGTQTRSRAIISGGSSTPCPGPLWQNKPCVAGPCLTYSWQIMKGTAECVRSDGLVVTGGCGDAPKPCIPECTIRGSVCSAVGACVCRPGLRPHYSEAMRYRLTKCIPNFNMSLAKSLPLRQAKYLPEGINGWMFAMIGVGSAFVLFVIISVYLMCKNPREQMQTPLAVHRQTLPQKNSAQSN